MSSKPTIKELEAILENEEEQPLEILANGEVRAKGRDSGLVVNGDGRITHVRRKPITLQEDLGGEY